MNEAVSLITDSVYRIGLDNYEKGSLVPNIYLVKCDSEFILVNPGPHSSYNEIKEKISSVTDPKKISLIVISSVSPDMSSALPLFSKRCC